MTTYTPEEMRASADNIDSNHPGWWKEAAMLRQAADDCERLDALDKLREAYGFEDLHEGNRWCIEGPFCDIRHAIDAEITARTPKEQTK